MKEAQCKIDKCGGNVIARGYCNKHYLRWRKHKDPLKTLHLKVCTIEGCDKQHFGNGLCNMHYARNFRHGNTLLKIRKPLFGDLQERFNQSYTINKETECWEWVRNLNANGYACMRMLGKNIQGHRLSYELYNGEISDNLFVCHSCDNRKCVNPKHLWLGTNKDNMQDMRNKGRGVKKKIRFCIFEGCNDIYYCRDYCHKHYASWKRGKI